MNLLTFLILGSIVITIVYVFYSIFLEKQHNPRLNRIYLISGVIAAFSLPFLQYNPVLNPVSGILLPEVISGFSLSGITDRPVTEQHTFTILGLLSWVYLAGAVGFLIFTMIPFVKVLRLIKQSPVKQIDGTKVYFAGGKVSQPFSFFNTIILPEKNFNECHPVIIKHEQAHIQLKHHYDLVLLFCLNMVFWFLPFAWWYKNKLKAIHEFEADSLSIKSTDRKTYMNCLMEQAMDIKGFSFFSHFSKPSLLNRRLQFLTENKQSGFSVYHLLFWPLLGSLIFMQSFAQVNADDTPDTEPAIFTVVEEMPEFEGGDTGLMEYLASVEYPSEAREEGIEGTVIVQFVVNAEAQVTLARIVRSSGNEYLDAATLQHIENMPDWKKAGKQRGKAVKVQFTVPIRFRIPVEEE